MGESATMNCPSRPDDVDVDRHPDWNQQPQALNRDATTRADLLGIVNLRENRENKIDLQDDVQDTFQANVEVNSEPPNKDATVTKETSQVTINPRPEIDIGDCPRAAARQPFKPASFLLRVRAVLVKYVQFIGPGFLIAVAYIDPGNYATDVEAGASTRFRHLFIILMSNLFAIFLQSLCIKLGTVTGLDLAANCRKHLPRWLTYILYVLAESAIIATDIAEVIGSAIALNLLLHIPLIAGCAITVVDVIFLLIFWRPNGSMMRLRIFEFFVMGLVLGVMACFCVQLTYIQDITAGEVFRGYVPSPTVIERNGIYLSCGILGATVMPHSIFLGSGLVQPRLRHFDQQIGFSTQSYAPDSAATQDNTEENYRPSIHAIRSCLKVSIIELGLSLFTFALFVNSSILIVSGASLYPKTEATEADLFSIHELLSKSLSQAAGTIFALALLLSGTSAGIVATMAGQMVSEGMLNWRIRPWLRRLITRIISIIPSIIIAGAVGRPGLNSALLASQVVLSVILPFVTAPLLWFTFRSSIMTIRSDEDGRRIDGEGGEAVNMRNGWFTTILAVSIWLVLVVMNVALLVLVGLGIETA